MNCIMCTGILSNLIGGFVVMFWAYRYRYILWTRWNYILAAAFEPGFNFSMLLIFLFLGAGKIVLMPNWVGNNADSSERCFALSEKIWSDTDFTRKSRSCSMPGVEYKGKYFHVIDHLRDNVKRKLVCPMLIFLCHPPWCCTLYNAILPSSNL
jgi:hypothetical protein